MYYVLVLASLSNTYVYVLYAVRNLYVVVYICLCIILANITLKD